MVNTYKRKSQRGAWSSETLKQAMAEAKQSSIRQASIKYGIPYGTLHRHLQSNSSEKNLGRFRPTFTPDEEKQLVEYIQKVDSLFYCLTRIEFMQLAGQFAKAKNKETRFKDDVAGKSWFKNFQKRNPKIVLRAPEPTSIARLKGFNKTQLNHFYALLEEQMLKNNIEPSRIYNMDETGVKTSTTKPPKILTTQGKRQVGIVSSLERGVLTTVICCCSAIGSYIPPFFIFKRKKMSARLLDGSPPGSQASVTDSGWVNSEKFYDWLQFFVEQVRPSPDKKVLLLLDNHESHKYYPALEYARENNVILLSFPPHTTHRLQPLDVAVYGPIKTFFEQEITTFQKQHPGRIINQQDICRLFCPAYLKGASALNAIKGFEASGIYPYNKNIFGDEMFAAAATLTQPDSIANSTEPPQEASSDTPNLEASQSTPVLEEPTQRTSPISTEPDPCTPTNAAKSFEYTVLTPDGPSTKSQTSIENTSEQVTPAHIRPIPKYTRQQITKRKRKTQKAEILTSTPVKDEQQNKMMRSIAKNIKQEKRPKFALESTVKSNKKMTSKPSTSNTKNKNLKIDPKMIPMRSTDQLTYLCTVCREVYDQLTETDDWIQCENCKNWTHELCSSYLGYGSYFCDDCDD